MQTQLDKAFIATPQGKIADSILRSCVHCGFCNATCPTYQLLGNELDGPRGRIYLMKQAFEGGEVTAKTLSHLDACLTCRACETTCPSGVKYGKLVDIGRAYVEARVPRTLLERIKRAVLLAVVPYPTRFALLVALGRLFKWAMPASLKQHIPAKQTVAVGQLATQSRKMLAFSGCAQSIATPATNAATAKVLNELGIELVVPKGEGCCGAMSHHLSQEERTKAFVKQNIDAWWPHIAAGAEAIVSTASGCGVHLKDYGHLLQHDSAYAAKAAKVSAMVKDISEILIAEDIEGEFARKHKSNSSEKLAMHVPCTLQHGQKLVGQPEKILTALGFQLCAVADSHLCCGSAGTYSILQPKLSSQLLANKVQALHVNNPQRIATANVGCQMHLSGGTNTPVQHWIELVADLL